MGKTLIIAEKPSVAYEYAKALEGDFARLEGFRESDSHVISWAIGHLLELAEPDHYDRRLRRWSINRLPIIPEQFKLQPTAESRKQLETLRALVNRRDVDDIVNGCDAGREGELIFTYIKEWIGTSKPVRRLWVSSMTREAILDGFKNLRDDAEQAFLVDAARSRSEADWLIGINGTRAATVRARSLGGVVSVGRVQTPTLALIVARDQQIDQFRPTPYFEVEAEFSLSGPEDLRYRGRWFENGTHQIHDSDRASRIVASVQNIQCRVASVRRTERRERTPLLFDLTSLQRAANSRFGLTAARTLDAAQRLYEGSSAGPLLTYPRTSSQYLPTDQAQLLKTIAADLANNPSYRAPAQYVLGLEALPLERIINDGAIGEHHAIIPTGQRPTRSLTGADAHVYDLVVRRFLAAFRPDALWQDTEIVTMVGEERFKTNSRRLVEAGWRAVYESVASEPSDDGDSQSLPAENGEQLADVQPDNTGACVAALSQARETRPPAHYSEASLLSAMQSAGKTIEDDELRAVLGDKGLGTPATRADMIEKLVKTEYIRRVQRTLRATTKGRLAIRVLNGTPLTSPELTADWEQRLSSIERGAELRDQFMADIREMTGALIDRFRGMTADDVRALWPTVGPCPRCDGQVREKRNIYGCTSWRSAGEPGCGFVVGKNLLGRDISPGEIAAVLENRSTRLLTGFRAATPQARLVLVDGHVHVRAEDGSRLDIPAADRQAIGTCPKCGQDVKENNRGFGCSSWAANGDAGCGFVIWNSIRGHRVTVDEARELIATRRTGILEFRLRRRSVTGRLELDAHQAVVAVDNFGQPLPAPVRRNTPAKAPRRRSTPSTRRSRRSLTQEPNGVVAPEAPAALPTDDNIVELLRLHTLEVVDRRSSGGALWVVGGDELSGFMRELAAQGLHFAHSGSGGKATQHRPAWWTHIPRPRNDASASGRSGLAESASVSVEKL